MKTTRLAILLLFAAALIFAPRGAAQSSANHSSSNSGGLLAPRFLWSEEFSGSTNQDGQVMDFDSAFGYLFSRHFGIDAGLPVYFVRGSSSSAGTTSENGLGDAYAQIRLAFPNPAINYKTVLTGTAPTGDKNKGLSSGHATFDWTNHFDRAFGRWVPFAEIGVGNSIPETFIFQRAFTSFGKVAHFEAGTGYRFTNWLGVSASAYDIAPWGTQTIFSRLVPGGGLPAGVGGHGRVFELANQTTGGSSLSADNGFSAGADLSPGSVMDFELGYSHSVHFQLDTFSFGVGVNMARLLRRGGAGM